MVKDIKSTKAGTVFDISVAVGEEIKVDQKIMVLETKKGTVEIISLYDGVVEVIKVDEGDEVKAEDVLVEISIATNLNFETASEMTKDSAIITCDLAIIGGGPGGYVAAIKAAKMGANVVLVERESLGGTCLNWGCIPTKALVRTAELFDNIKDIEDYGLSVGDYNVDMAKVIKRKNAIVESLVDGIHYLVEKNNIKLIKGSGRLEDKNTVIVEAENQITQIISKNIIIATGSETTRLSIPGSYLKGVLDSKELLDLQKLPEKLAIIGGGVIGMEFAFIYSSFGVEVSVIEYLDDILPMLDEDVIKVIRKAAEDKGIRLYTGSEVKEIIDTNDDKYIVQFTTQGEIKDLSVDKVLMAVGRKPFLKGLQLEKAGVETNEKGHGIKVNTRMQTTTDNIYAIGDVTNMIQLAHVASHQGIVAVENILNNDVEMDYTAVPSAIFTHPEIAAVGLTEKEARHQGLDVEAGIFPYAANGKALAMGDDRGFIKIVKDKNSKKIVGATIIGINAADLIASLTLIIKNELTTKQIIETIFAHPTTAEIIHEGILSVEGGALHFAE